MEDMTVLLTIGLNKAGTMVINGPVHQKDFCLEILIQAMNTILKHNKPKVVVPGAPN